MQQEFGEIRKETAAQRESADARSAELAAQRQAEVRQAVEGISVEGVVQRVSGLGLEITRALAEVSEKLVREVDLLASLREAAEQERQELGRLHKIDLAATALSQ
ncbi:MAG: hypothetical protein HY822_11545, partial [Acidobacteria bacterium]|nr:hypothetical protein [Acidobacteriota bacterium]